MAEHPLSIDRCESLSHDRKRDPHPQDRSLDGSIGLHLDQFWNEPTTGRFVLTDRIVHDARSQQRVDRSARSPCFNPVAGLQLMVYRRACSQSSVDRSGRSYHSWFAVRDSWCVRSWLTRNSGFSPEPKIFNSGSTQLDVAEILLSV